MFVDPRQPAETPALSIQPNVLDLAMLRYEAEKNFSLYQSLASTSVNKTYDQDPTFYRDFLEAIGTDQLSLHYQPIMDIGSGLPVGFEAFMRWNHPKRGAISPGVFIPMAEKTGLIIDASRWALREACRALKRIQLRSGAEHTLFMSVNFSSADFAEENFLDQLYTILSDTDVPPQSVRLEIMEDLLLSQPSNAQETLDLCHKAGLEITIDDFGMGTPNLSYLETYPVGSIKIDQAFIRKMTQHQPALDLVHSIIELAKAMNIETVAEGVETSEEYDLLRTMGCDMAQGYFLSKPFAEHDVIEKLIGWRNDGMVF